MIQSNGRFNQIWWLVFAVVAALMLMEYFGFSVVLTSGKGPDWEAVRIATAVPAAPAAPSPQMAITAEPVVILAAPATVTPGPTVSPRADAVAVELVAVTAVPSDGPRIGQGCKRDTPCPGAAP